MMDVEIVTLAQRPDVEPQLGAFADLWPEFMKHDPLAPLYYGVAHQIYADYVLVGLEPNTPHELNTPHGDRVLAVAYSVPFAWAGAELPAGGWDEVVQRAALSRLRGVRTNLVAGLEITIDSRARGTGLSAKMLDALCRNAARLGAASAVFPVRPNGKHNHPDLSMADYAALVRDDGLPVDPWLRVHVRAGGRIEQVASRSMAIPGTLTEWRSWTGLPFDTSGPVHVPGALVPVHCEVAHDYAVYIEPNVWVRRSLS